MIQAFLGIILAIFIIFAFSTPKAFAATIFTDDFSVDPSSNGWLESQQQIDNTPPPFSSTAVGNIGPCNGCDPIPMSAPTSVIMEKTGGRVGVLLIIERTIDTTGFTDLSLNLAAFEDGNGVSVWEYFEIEIDTGSGFTSFLKDVQCWNAVQDLVGEEPTGFCSGTTLSTSTGDLALPATADNNSNFKVRISALINTVASDRFLDNFELSEAGSEEPPASGGESTHTNPTIGLDNNGRLLVTCGVAFDSTCFDMTSLFHYEIKMYEMMSGTHTISITTYCANGVHMCNYVGIGIMPYSEDMNNPTWKIELRKDHLGNLTPVIYDPEGFLGEVTVTAQIVDGKFWLVSFTIEFKNKDTGPMKFAVEVRDVKRGVQTTYLNEGVRIKDADAYPYIETAFEKPLEIEPLCIGENANDRHTCTFAKVRDWATKNAEETLRQMLNNEYTYK